MLHELDNMNSIVLNCTTRCNFRCKHCLRDHPHQDKDIDLNLLKRVLKELKCINYNYISITGGEPCLHPQFEDMIDLIAKYSDFYLVSNGYYYKKYRYVLDNHLPKIRLINISLDGIEKTHDFIRGNGSFKQAVNAIRYFKNFGVNITIPFCINKINKGELKDLVFFADKLGVGLHVLSTLRTKENTKLILSAQERQECIKLINDLSNKVKISLSYAPSMLIDRCIVFNTPEPVINPYGELLFCYFIVGNRNSNVGSLYNNKFIPLFEKIIKVTKDLQSIRNECINKERFSHLFNSCEFCNYYFHKYFNQRSNGV